MVRVGGNARAALILFAVGEVPLHIPHGKLLEPRQVGADTLSAILAHAAFVGRRRFHRLCLCAHKVRRRHVGVAKHRTLLQLLDGDLVFFVCCDGAYAKGCHLHAAKVRPLLRKHFVAHLRKLRCMAGHRAVAYAHGGYLCKGGLQGGQKLGFEHAVDALTRIIRCNIAADIGVKEHGVNDLIRILAETAQGDVHVETYVVVHYAKSGTLIFTGLFENDMLVESEMEREKRGESFKLQCEDMDELMYDACMAEDNIFGYPVHIWGFPLGMAEQAASGTVVLGHFADDSYPVCLLYRYAVDEPKMIGDDWVNAWGVVTGLFAYTDANGNPAICPQVEVVCWDNEQEGL